MKDPLAADAGFTLLLQNPPSRDLHSLCDLEEWTLKNDYSLHAIKDRAKAAAAQDHSIVLYDSFDWRLLNRETFLYSVAPYNDETKREEFRFFLRPRGKSCATEEAIICRPIDSALPYPFAQDFYDLSTGGLEEQGGGRRRSGDCLSSVTRLRAFLPRARLALKSESYELRDNISKRIADIELLRLTPASFENREVEGDELLLLRGNPLRGFDKELGVFFKTLERWAAKSHSSDKKLYTELFRRGGSKPFDYSSKLRLSLDPNTPASELGRTVISYFFGIMEKNEEGVLEDIDTEFLHDYRVALRRLRTFVSEVKAAFPKKTRKKLSGELKELFSLTTDVRDLDVLLLTRPEFHSLLPEEYHRGLEPFFDWVEERRSSNLDALRAHLRSSAYREFTQRWLDYTEAGKEHGKEESIYGIALERIGSRAEKVHEAIEEVEASSYSSEKLHELRIQCKKLRYLSEIFADLFPREDAGSFIKRLKKLQDVIGDHHDAVVQQETLEYAEKQLDGNRPELLKSLGALSLRLHDRETELFRHIGEEVKTYRSYLEKKAPSFLSDYLRA